MVPLVPLVPLVSVDFAGQNPLFCHLGERSPQVNRRGPVHSRFDIQVQVDHVPGARWILFFCAHIELRASCRFCRYDLLLAVVVGTDSLPPYRPISPRVKSDRDRRCAL